MFKFLGQSITLQNVDDADKQQQMVTSCILGWNATRPSTASTDLPCHQCASDVSSTMLTPHTEHLYITYNLPLAWRSKVKFTVGRSYVGKPGGGINLDFLSRVDRGIVSNRNFAREKGCEVLYIVLTTPAPTLQVFFLLMHLF